MPLPPSKRIASVSASNAAACTQNGLRAKRSSTHAYHCFRIANVAAPIASAATKRRRDILEAHRKRADTPQNGERILQAGSAEEDPRQADELIGSVFLQSRPALATGRGELITPLDFFPALAGAWMLLVHPGFGISTQWAYEQLARHPEALHGKPGRAQRLISLLQTAALPAAGKEFYNSLEAPALLKYPLLQLFQECFREHGAAAVLMSGSGSATFALTDSRAAAETLLERFQAKFGPEFWTALVEVA